MSTKNRKRMYDQLVATGRIKDIVPRLIDEFGDPENKQEVDDKSEEARKRIAAEEAAKKKKEGE